MTWQQRIEHYAARYAKWPASRPVLMPDIQVGQDEDVLWLAEEKGRPVLYGVWVIGATWGNLSDYYGSYPRSYLERVHALFPDVEQSLGAVLHAFAGSLPPGRYTRLDLRRIPGQVEPDVQCSVYDAAAFLPHAEYSLALADPPYSDADAVHYGTPMVNRGRATTALARVVHPGGHLVWLDTVWPMHSLVHWRTVGRIFLVRSTNHRVRLATVFERTDYMEPDL